MAKKITGQIKLQIPAGQANPAPPVPVTRAATATPTSGMLRSNRTLCSFVGTRTASFCTAAFNRCGFSRLPNGLP